MPDIEALEALRDEVRHAAPGFDVNAELHHLFPEVRSGLFPDYVDYYTDDVSCVINLVEKVLPGWAWKIGTCSISDDAWLAPDFNSPEHGERLRAQFPDLVAGSLWDTGVDIDSRPAGQPALALIEALLTALIEMKAA